MRKWALLLLIAGLQGQAWAANRIRVEQLRQLLSAAQSRPDAQVAQQIADLELTERLNAASLETLKAELPGENSRQALGALADASAFLDLPVAERPVQPAPTVAEQRRMLALTVKYVAKAIPQLPNFFATEHISRFEDTPMLQTERFFIPYQPMHSVASVTATVLYRHGQEAIDTGASKKPPPMMEGLTTRGIFGPILSTVILDAAQSKLEFSHWESGPAGLEAVFGFVVPREKSHYEVSYCCETTQSTTLIAALQPFKRLVGYSGDLAIDPDAGTILRLRVQAELRPSDPVVKAAILVEYGPMEIAGKFYICPLKSISYATAQAVQRDPLFRFPLANQVQPLKKSLNHVDFTQYHVFRAETRVLAEQEHSGTEPNPASASVESPETKTARSTTPPAAPAEAALPLAAGSNPPPVEPGIASLHAAPFPPEPAEPEMTVGEAPAPPNTPLKAQSPAPDSEFVLHTTARLVDVNVVAVDKKGHPVTDLKAGNFEVYDNGRKQEVRYFAQASEAVPAPVSEHSPDTPEPPIFTNRPVEFAGGVPAKSNGDRRALILMIDAANLAWSDLSYARAELLRLLHGLPPGEPVALYLLKTTGFQVLAEPTGDHALIAEKLSRWMPSAQELSAAQDEENRNRQHVDWVAHESDLAYVNGNDGSEQAGGELHGVDPKLRAMGSNPQVDLLLRLEMVAKHLGLYPGHKSLVWISSDNVLADWTGQAASREDKGSHSIDPFTLRAREALNESHVSLYPVDVSQLEAGVISADLQNRLVEAKLRSLPGEPPPPPPNPTGRYAAEMHQDTHAIQSEFRELAEATGGRALRRASDIASELNGIVDDGRSTYQISFTPDQPADGKYHQLMVRVTGRKDLKFRYRTGYEYDQEPVTLRDRFHRAVWAAADAKEIGVTAVPAIGPTGPALKLSIAATDLGLAQQGGLWTGKLDVFLVERDAEGAHATALGKTLGLRLKPATYQRVLGEGVPFEVAMRARPGAGSFRVVVVDENSGRMGSVTIPAARLVAKP